MKKLILIKIININLNCPFQNFMKNSMRVRDSQMVKQCWEALSVEIVSQVRKSQEVIVYTVYMFLCIFKDIKDILL